jgi:hypothetical protein
MYLDNKYSTWYYNIVSRGKERNTTEYTEKHHIIPKSLGGSNQPSNLVKLTPREHYICHLLLVRMTTGQDKFKMIHAIVAYTVWTTGNHKRNLIVNSRTIDTLKKARAIHLIEEMNKPENKLRSSLGAKKIWDNPQHRERQSELRKLIWKNPEYLEKMSNRTKTTKQVMIENKFFPSLKEAATSLNLDPSTISKRCSSSHEKYVNWKYV